MAFLLQFQQRKEKQTMYDERTRQIAMKRLEEMNVIDDFLFTEIMANEKNGLEVCRIILSCVLKRKIGKIRFTYQKVVQGETEESHGIRMDAYITEEDGDGIRVYDVEPDKQAGQKSQLPKRSRYYSSLIDSKLLKPGKNYKNLPELVTIFILSYDPFGENAMYYEAGTVVKTHPHIPYDDGVRRLFLYVNGDLPEGAGDDDQSIRNLLRYIGKSTEANVTDENTKKLNSIVKSTKHAEDTGERYMKSWERDEFIRDEAFDQGLAQGEEERKKLEEENKKLREEIKRLRNHANA